MLSLNIEFLPHFFAIGARNTYVYPAEAIPEPMVGLEHLASRRYIYAPSDNTPSQQTTASDRFVVGYQLEWEAEADLRRCI